MTPPRISKFGTIAALFVLGTTLGMGSAAAIADDVEVLTRGPVHEAFAGTVTFNPVPGVVVTRECPAPIAESPPDLKPEGANVSWIPGYWAWDDERNGFLWISGIWRDLPHGRQWVPGYWTVCESGYQWTPGYWASASLTEVEYLPEPPQTVEVTPTEAAPSADHVWMPGIWLWRHGHFVWRPGFWAVVEAGWSWIPDHYVWSSRGCIFVNGYWDYSLARRGTLFAPVCFTPNIVAQTAFVYSPTIVIGLDNFVDHLFLRPNYCHYYFGDYYAVAYDRAGFYPCFAFHEHHGYDPIFVHERWEHRRDREWEHRVAFDFRNRREHVELRPPRTFALQQSLVASGRSANRNLIVAAPLRQVAASKSGSMRFLPVSHVEAKHFATLGAKIQETRHERQTHESKVKTRVPPAEATRSLHTERSITKPLDRAAPHSPGREPQVSLVNKARLPQSPIVSSAPAHLGHAYVPPKAHTPPKPDLKIEAKPGKVGSSELRPSQRGPSRQINPVHKPGVIGDDHKKV
ncbi:MAG TPA: hypothetical protein VGP63_00025 [Planctomycetaceae bacterium]|nr:hypothetical protein [Planctomycetaceae bacterium]